MKQRRHGAARLMLLAAAAGLLLLCPAAAAQAAVPSAGGPPYAARRPAVMLFGDSLTEWGTGWHWKPEYQTSQKGWTAALAEAYSRKADVLNRGMAGYNTRWALQALPMALADAGCTGAGAGPAAAQRARAAAGWRQRLAALAAGSGGGSCRVALMTIWFGANDAVDPSGSDGRLAVPLAEYKRNLAALVAAARQAGVGAVVLMTPPPVDEDKWAKERGLAASDRTNARVSGYAAATREVAAAAGVPLVDVHAAFEGAQGGPSPLLSDGVHLSAAGNAAVAAALWSVVRTAPELAGARPGELPTHFPQYDQVDAANPASTFRELQEQQLVVPAASRQQREREEQRNRPVS